MIFFRHKTFVYVFLPDCLSLSLSDCLSLQRLESRLSLLQSAVDEYNKAKNEFAAKVEVSVTPLLFNDLIHIYLHILYICTILYVLYCVYSIYVYITLDVCKTGVQVHYMVSLSQLVESVITFYFNNLFSGHRG